MDSEDRKLLIEIHSGLSEMKGQVKEFMKTTEKNQTDIWAKYNIMIPLVTKTSEDLSWIKWIVRGTAGGLAGLTAKVLFFK